VDRPTFNVRAASGITVAFGRCGYLPGGVPVELAVEQALGDFWT